jgi:uncharacterized membrane protein YdjX (TVP38/TMEM64 family)
MQGLNFPAPDLGVLFQGAAIIIGALMAFWVVRKLIKLANKS